MEQIDYPTHIISVEDLREKSPDLFQNALENLNSALGVHTDYILETLLSNSNFLTNIDVRWLLGFQVNVMELKTRKYLTSSLVMRLLYQHPDYIHKLSIPAISIDSDNFVDFINKLIKTTYSARNLLMGYSPNYSRISTSQKLIPHTLRQLLLLYQIEVADYGELGVISMLSRARKVYIDKERDVSPLDNRVKYDQHFSDLGRELLEQYYWSLS